MRLTKKEKEVIAKLIKAEIESLSTFINNKKSPLMKFDSTEKYILELENILKKINS